MDLAQRLETVSTEGVREISPKVAEAYAGGELRTIQWDLEELIDIKLVRSERKGYRANIELMSSFLADVLQV